ncbi:MAG: hypothetical protein IPI33_07100 [Dehalococcoidia bacterium]|nr:hypothetical protein [Dehalococcoidia bacterium]
MATLTLRGGHVWDGRAGTSSPSSVVVDGRFLAGADVRRQDPGHLGLSHGGPRPHRRSRSTPLFRHDLPAWRTTYENDTLAKMLLRMASYGRRMLVAGEHRRPRPGLADSPGNRIARG